MTVKPHMCFIGSLKSCRAFRKLGELWNAECDVIDEEYLDGVKQRGINPGHKILQISVDSLKL